MSTIKTQEELLEHKKQALNAVEHYIDSLIDSNEQKIQSKADKLSYWLKDYIRFLGFEPKFKPESYIRYKRGQIVKVHLGYNVGSEEGGLHYAIVIDKNNSIKSPIINIVPLTSVKHTTDVTNIRNDLGQIFLGNELYRLLDAKTKTLFEIAKKENKELNEQMALVRQAGWVTPEALSNMETQINKNNDDINLIEKMMREISKMKRGSIALVGQITTVSKIRIYDPKTKYNVLSNIIMSDETLNKIDSAIINMFTYNKSESVKK